MLDPRVFEIAAGVACCPLIKRCRSEMLAVGKSMPLPMPSPDFVGSRYAGLVIVAGNPGIAHSAIHTLNDNRMFTLQSRIAKGEQDAFDELLSFLPESMRHWRQMVGDDARRRLQFDIEEVAYVELVKCATRPGHGDTQALFRATAILERCWNLHTSRLLEILQPRFVIGLWKPVIATLQNLGFRFPPGGVVGSFDGSRNLPLQERYRDAARVMEAFKAATSPPIE